MNRNNLKTYAPAARREFIQAVTDRAHFWGLSEAGIEPMEESGDLAIIGGRPFPRAIAAKRHKLEEWIRRESFPQVMEAIAYTWFNRFMALRYMEVNGFLEHGCRVLSNPSNSPVPEILDRAAEIVLPGLDKEKVIELKMDGGKDAELYRLLLVAQCNALHTSMPFLFERIDDETELLLPDNLLHSDSLIRKLVTEIDEEDWKEVEIIGWLYQFYISEKKDEVFEGLKRNRKITPENIPAATQLFTPHWIVRYLVENSLGRLWMLNHPDSRLIERMDYYIKPQQPETDFLRISSPEELKICDPACGSGHMLVYAFDLLHAIYEEAGYERSEIPGKILTHNLYGIEIDERAGELAAFVLTMKARGQYRRFFQTNVRPHICVLKKITFEPNELKNYMDFVGRDLFTTPLQITLRQFEEADNFGSLIRPEVTDVAGMLKILESKDVSGQLFLSPTHQKVLQALQQADYLGPKYHVVIANPPYMGSSGFNQRLKEWCEQQGYTSTRSDIYACFIQRTKSFLICNGIAGMVTRQDWVFTKSFLYLREEVLAGTCIANLALLGKGVFETLSGEVVQPIVFCLINRDDIGTAGSYINITNVPLAEKPSAIVDSNNFFNISQAIFNNLPLKSFIFWRNRSFYSMFQNASTVDDVAFCREGIHTGNNDIFLKLWWEIQKKHLVLNASSYEDLDARGKYVPYNKGGTTNKWYGGNEWVIAFSKDHRDEMQKIKWHVRPSESLFFKEGGTWADVASKGLGFRYYPSGFLFDGAGPVVCGDKIKVLIANMNSRPFYWLCSTIMPNLHFKCGTIKMMPVARLGTNAEKRVDEISYKCIEIATADYDSIETSWGFSSPQLLLTDYCTPTLKTTYTQLRVHLLEMLREMLRLEEENNGIFIDAYGLRDELMPDVQLSEITLTCNPHYRYGGDKTEEELDALLLADTMNELISYAVGCMMGRYGLDHPGLLYANSGNVGFDPAKYEQFPADEDGIVPVMDMQWFPDDAAARFEEFLCAAWLPETLEENLKFVAAALSPKGSETPRETIRRYISTQFFKDHMQTYKKRPIYWLFSSGKQRAFECLVYLHRYNESTLSRIRNEYVTPLQGKFAAQIDFLSNEIGAATSTAERNRLQKQLDTLKKKKEELASFDEVLRHYADQRIALDLDDGVKVNYGKFGNLLADVKAVTGAGD